MLKVEKLWYPSFVSLLALLMRTCPIWQGATIRASRSAATRDSEKFATQEMTLNCFKNAEINRKFYSPLGCMPW